MFVILNISPVSKLTFLKFICPTKNSVFLCNNPKGTLLLPRLTLFRLGGGGGGGEAKRPTPTSFSPVTSTDVGISPKNFLTFSFNPFDRLV